MSPARTYVGSTDPRLVEAVFSGRELTAMALRKLARRVVQPAADHAIKPVITYDGLAVFDRSDLDGAGMDCGAGYPRVLLELGLGRCDRIFEFCAGPGYIGYYLLSLGFCRSLCMADINPVAVEAARMTAEFNRLTDRVNVWESDVLDSVPAGEVWDLVVGNPPHFLPGDWKTGYDIRAVDAGWDIHRRFYAGVKRFMRPGGHIVIVESCRGSTPDIFEPMIRAGGGSLVRSIQGRDVQGRPGDYYFIASRW